MNRNDKAAKKFLETREAERKLAAKYAGKKYEDCQFRSWPLDKKVRRNSK